MGSTLFANIAYSVPGPFMPIEFKSKDIDQLWIGWIFTAYPIAIVIFSPMVVYVIKWKGRKFPMVLGLFVMGVSFIGIGLLQFVHSKPVYIIIALLCRALQGAGSTLIQTTMYSIATNIYTNNSTEFIGYLQANEGLGILCGPLFGSALYAIGGYNFLFYALGAIFIAVSLFAKYIISNKIDKRDN